MMRADKTYRRLQQHLDKQPIGFPSTIFGSDIRVLKMLFSIEEAKLALHLSHKPQHFGENSFQAEVNLKKKTAAMQPPKNEEEYFDRVMANKKNRWGETVTFLKVLLGMRNRSA